VVRPGADPVLVVPALEHPRAQASPASDATAMEPWLDGSGDPYGIVAKTVGDARARVGVSDRMWAVHLLRLERATGAGFESAAPVMSMLRIRKHPEELDLLRRAGAAADAAFDRLVASGLSGRTEEDVSTELAAHLLEAGHQSVAFAMVGGGPNGASPHHEPGERRIEPGDAVVLDFGGRVGGYCSDITRTVAVGEVSGEVHEVHEVVAAAQEAGVRAVRPGVAAQDVDRAAREVIAAAGFGDFFIHRTGHGIGLEEHEDPYLVAGNTQPLEVGHCFSVEPGVYLPGRFGVRIEDIVTVTADGVERLNEAPRVLTRVG